MKITKNLLAAFALMLLVVTIACAKQQPLPTTQMEALSDTEANILCEYNTPPSPHGQTPYYIRCENPVGLDGRYGLAYKRDGFCTDNNGTASTDACIELEQLIE